MTKERAGEKKDGTAVPHNAECNGQKFAAGIFSKKPPDPTNDVVRGKESQIIDTS
jgi:hypothetical protein